MARPYPELKSYKGSPHDVQSFFRWLEMHPELQCASSTVEKYGNALDGQVSHAWHSVAVFYRYYPECVAPAAASLSRDGSNDLPAWPVELLEGWLDYMRHYEQRHDVGYIFSVLENTLPPALGGRNTTTEGSLGLVQRLVPLIGAFLRRGI